MKKKLFFKFLVFAVIAAFVTVTSCNDYDDDISGLQKQISENASANGSAISALQTHKHGIIVCDESATDELKVSTYKYFKEIEKDNL